MMCERYDKKKVFYIFFFKCGGDILIIEIPHIPHHVVLLLTAVVLYI